MDSFFERAEQALLDWDAAEGALVFERAETEAAAAA